MKTILSIISILFIYFAKSQETEQNLLVHYKFNGSFDDTSENGFHGINHGTAFTTDRFGNPESAVWFDGTDDYIEFPNLNELKPELPVSFSFWVKYDIVEGEFNYLFNTSFEEGVSSGIYFCTEKTTGKYAISYGDGTPFFSEGTRRTFTSEKVIDADNWHHVLAVIEGTENMRIFVDCRDFGGTHSGSGGSLSYSPTPGEIGRVDRDTTVPTSYFKGALDDFRYWGRAVSENEILELCTETQLNTEDFSINSKIVVYLNPVKDQLQFKADFPVYSYSIYNQNGQRVDFGTVNDSEIKISQLDKGIYYIKLFGKEKSESAKFIKE